MEYPLLIAKTEYLRDVFRRWRELEMPKSNPTRTALSQWHLFYSGIMRKILFRIS